MMLKSRDFNETFGVLKVFKELSIDDLTFRFDTNGFRVKEVNRGMQTYLDAYFKASGFDEFELDKDSKGEVFTVSLKAFSDFTFNKDDRITIRCDDLGKNLLLSAEGDTMTTLNLPLLDNPKDESSVPIEAIKNNTSLIELDLKAFKTILKNYLKEESIQIELKDDLFRINTERGQETKIFKGTDIIKEIKGNAKSRYSMEYLKLLNKIDTKTFTNIKLEFKNDFPIVFTLENDYIKVEYVVAPRVCEE